MRDGAACAIYRGRVQHLRPPAGESVELGDAACVLNAGAVLRPQLDEDPLAYWLLLDLATRRATWLGVSVPEPEGARSPYARWRARQPRAPR
jgi:hypothetical protein